MQLMNSLAEVEVWATQRGAGCTDGMYAEFKGTPAERSKGKKVSLAETDRLLASSSPTGLNMTVAACAPQYTPECVQVDAFSRCT